MFPVMFAAVRPRISCVGVLLLSLLLPVVTLGEGDQAREVALKKDFTTDPARELPPLFIDDAEIAGEVKKLLEKEAKLARIEASIAGDLSGRLSGAGGGSVWQSLWECMTKSTADDLVAPVAMASQATGALVGFAMDEAPARMRLYWLGTLVAHMLDETVSKRHALENKYLDRLLGQTDSPDGKTPAKTYFDSGEQIHILETLRARADAVRGLRQETIDSFLLTRRAVDRSGLPTATIERANDLWMSDVAEVERLEREVEAARSRLRELLADRETKLALVRHIEKLIKECDPEKDKERKAALEKKLQRAKTQLSQAEQAIEAQNQKIGQLNQAIEKEKLGYDSTKGGVRKEAWTKEKLDELGAAISSGYAELALRRRIMKRITREAVHNYEIAERLSSFRRMHYTGKQREAIIMGPQAYSGKELRGAYIDQGIVCLCQRERRDEDSFLLELDYALRMVSAAKKFGVDALKKKFDDLLVIAKQFDDPAQTDAEAYKRSMAELRRQLRFFVDEVETFKEVGGGAFSVFIENAKTLLVVTGTYEARLEVEKTHEKVRNKRKDTDEQVKLLDEARNLDDGAVVGHFGIAQTKEPWKFAEFQKKPKTKALELFYKDKMFHDTLDGGLRRIASAGVTTRLDRAVAEYLIAYEKACYTLQELTRTQNEFRGLDPESGEFSFKLFLSPVRTLVAAGRCAFGCLRLSEIELWVGKRSEQLENMRLVFDQLKASDFNWPKSESGNNRHLGLLWEHPEYRRFWNKLLQENHSDRQAGLVRAQKTYQQWFSKQVVEEKLELLEESTPSPKFLAPAHFQDSKDLTQTYNYPAALQSLIQANTLDPDVVSTEQINQTEDMMAWWETGEKWGRLATEIADQCVWALISQGVMNQVVGSLRTGLANFLKVPPPPVPPMSLTQTFGNVIKGYFNPLRNIISYETFKTQGILAAVGRFAKETTYELAEDSFKEEVLLRHFQMDPALADRLAGMMFNLMTESLEASVEVSVDAGGRQITKFKDSETYQRIVSSAWFYRCAKIKNRILPPPPADPEQAVKAKEPVEDWREKRKLEKQTEQALVDQELAKLVEDGTEKAAEPGKKPGETEEDSPASRRKRLSSDEAERQRQWLNLRKQLLSQDPTPENIAALLKQVSVDFDRAQKMLEGKMSEAERQKVIDECIEFTRMFESSMKEIATILRDEHAKTGGPKVLADFLKKADVARQVVHRESFNNAIRVLKHGTTEEIAAFMERAEKVRAAKLRKKGLDPGEPLTRIPPERVRQMLLMMDKVVPTGSAGSLGRKEGGEYKPYESDIDFTMLLKKVAGIDPAKPHERVVLEELLTHSLREVGKGIDVDKFEAAYMVDDASKFTGEAIDRQGFKKVMEEVQRIKKSPEFKDEAARQEALDDVLKQFKDALDVVEADLDHPERYRTDGRLRMLWYLTSLGDHTLELADDGQMVKKMKKDTPGETTQGGGRPKNAELEDWMAPEIILDDLFFAGKKAEGVANEMHELGDKPSAGKLKESGKRNIRELVGFCCDDPVLKEKINKLLELAARGEYADHQTFCEEVVKDMKARGVDTDPPLKDLLQHIELMGKFKNDPDPDKWVENAGGAPRKSPDDTKILTGGMRNHSILASRMAKAACNGIQKHMGPIFESKKQKSESVERAKKSVADLEGQLSRAPPGAERQRLETELGKTKTALRMAETELKLTEMIIRKKLLTCLAGFHYQGGHLPEIMRPKGQPNGVQRALLEAFKAAGASEADILSAFDTVHVKIKKKVKEPDGTEVEKVVEQFTLREKYGSLVSETFTRPPRAIEIDTRRRFPEEGTLTPEGEGAGGSEEEKEEKDKGGTGGGAGLPPAPNAPKPDNISYVPEWRFRSARVPAWMLGHALSRCDLPRMAA